MGGDLPSEFSQLTSMEKLLLDDNAFSGDITDVFNGMTAMEYLFIEDNDFEATLDETFLADLKNLTQLDVSDNNMQGSVPAHLFDVSAHPRMQLLDLHGNGLSGDLPDVTATNEFILFVALHDNAITGNVPTSWAQFLPKLFHLDLSNNALDGPMSTDIGNMTSLRYLFLADNDFEEGPIPSSYANLTALEEISLKTTLRNGELPDFITSWKSLVLLDLDNNALSGPLPEALGNLTNLEYLLLNRNQFSGTIPASLGNLINLRAVFLEQNQLTGTLNTTICQSPAFALQNGANVGNQFMAADCGTSESSPTKLVECSCCTICCTPGVTKCHDESEIANLNPEWEIGYGRFSFNFGNDTRFVDSDFLVRRRGLADSEFLLRGRRA
jgi:Leucine-rich repeat (LRR) protein